MTMTSTTKNIVCVVSASDSSGHAGHQCDLRVVQDLGAHGVSVISGLTAQNSQAIDHIHVTPADSFRAQWRALTRDLTFDAVKVGLLLSIDHIQCLIQCRDHYQGLLIADPVLSSTSGTEFGSTDFLTAYRQLIAHVDLLTPNIPEAEQLLDTVIRSDDDIINAAAALRAMGAKAVLIKGGHRHARHAGKPDNAYVYDYFDDGLHRYWLRHHTQYSHNTRGTGCTLAAAVAVFVAQGKALPDAVVLACAYVQQGIRCGFRVGQGNGLLANMGWPKRFSDYPNIAERIDQFDTPAHASCGTLNLGLYPVVDSIEWVERLLKLGITTLQLRIKETKGHALEHLIAQAVILGNQYKARLFINDHWRLAIKHRAYGVHLGQEDLDTANLQIIQQSGLRLGLSSHSEFEWLRAMSLKPSYLAMGAVFKTGTKAVKTIGLKQLAQWSQVLKPHVPLVAIGGIDHDNIQQVLECGVGSVAVISAVTAAEDYRTSALTLHQRCQQPF